MNYLCGENLEFNVKKSIYDFKVAVSFVKLGL